MDFVRDIDAEYRVPRSQHVIRDSLISLGPTDPIVSRVVGSTNCGAPSSHEEDEKGKSRGLIEGFLLPSPLGSDSDRML
jgi:hypothetical protein